MTTGQISEKALQYFEEKKIKSILEEAMHNLLLHLPEDPLAFLQETFHATTPYRLIVAGLPGCGKGTQAQLLASKYNLLVINSRKLLIQEYLEKTPIGLRIESDVQAGGLVSDEIVVELIIREVRRAEKDYKGWILDEFPQNRAHVISLQRAGISPQKFFYLSITEDVTSKRCKQKTNLSSGAENDPVLRVLQCDDSPEGVVSRIKYFTARKDELIDSYSTFFYRIDASVPIEVVHREMCDQIDSLDIAN